MVRLLIFGASSTAGAWDNEGGWANRLIAFLFQKVNADPNFYGFAYNLGISGDTTKDLLERMEFETKMRIKETEETVFIVDIGANDSCYEYAKKDFTIPSEEFKKNIKNIIGITRKFSKKIIIMGPWPMDDSKLDPIPWAEHKSYKNEYIKQYNEIVKEVCEQENVYYINTYDKFLDGLQNNISHDGCHPSTQGHKLVFEIIRDFLIENKILEE